LQHYHKEGCMKKRIFIVTPNGENTDDHRHDICTTSSRMGFLDVYGADLYEVVGIRQSLKAAIRLAGKHGSKRPAVI